MCPRRHMAISGQDIPPRRSCPPAHPYGPVATGFWAVAGRWRATYTGVSGAMWVDAVGQMDGNHYLLPCHHRPHPPDVEAGDRGVSAAKARRDSWELYV